VNAHRLRRRPGELGVTSGRLAHLLTFEVFNTGVLGIKIGITQIAKGEKG
jgi:hypothetical protein